MPLQWIHGDWGMPARASRDPISMPSPSPARSVADCPSVAFTMTVEKRPPLSWEAKRTLVSYGSGVLFSLGWWLMFDACVYSNEAFPQVPYLTFVSWLPGVLSTAGLIAVNSIPDHLLQSPSPYLENAFGRTTSHPCARILVLVSFSLTFFGLIGGFYVMGSQYLMPGLASIWPGVAICLQNSLVFASTYLFKYGRYSDPLL
ncbi:uncharacterized protein BJ171DRAFT_512798 [Polychytrium aggregatum]|uniref:uncharacterized protein n=1 Tax=Polychytrium aggregatum TaxID=110093 RepID=UPI0022FEC50B|nr:uncharacterized protein BJ171DRAFT_512798 [Polychytrium aggregatum]KAI9202640.1 hypothetical protein BJ171DRAFT_512798 [Polychytrium aggregatum]